MAENLRVFSLLSIHKGEFMESILNFDLAVFEWVRETLWNPVTDTVMTAYTHLGEGGIIWIILGAILLIPKKTRKAGIAVLASVIVMKVFNNLVLKDPIARPRPFNLLTGWEGIKEFPELAARWAEEYIYPNLVDYPSSWSFPSGHTAAAFAAATGLTLATRKASVGIPVFIAAALMGFTRLYLHVHYCTDVIGGALAGIIYGIAGYFIAVGVCRVLKKFQKN